MKTKVKTHAESEGVKNTIVIIASLLLIILVVKYMSDNNAETALKTNISTAAITAKATTTTHPDIVPTIKLTQKVETGRFILYVPDDWTDVTEEHIALGKSYEAYFSGQGSKFPLLYRGGPVYLNLWVQKMNYSSSLRNVVQAMASSYTENPDRIFPEGFNVTAYQVNLTSGEEAYLMYVRYLINSSSLNQSRYDLITLDPVENMIYAMALTVQYKPDFDTAEKELELNELAGSMFRTFQFKP